MIELTEQRAEAIAHAEQTPLVVDPCLSGQPRGCQTYSSHAVGRTDTPGHEWTTWPKPP
jgi:hypothetical protein